MVPPAPDAWPVCAHSSSVMANAHGRTISMTAVRLHVRHDYARGKSRGLLSTIGGANELSCSGLARRHSCDIASWARAHAIVRRISQMQACAASCTKFCCLGKGLRAARSAGRGGKTKRRLRSSDAPKLVHALGENAFTFCLGQAAVNAEGHHRQLVR